MGYSLGATGKTSLDTNALHDALSRPEALAAQLYQAVQNGNNAQIWGHLLGAELAAARPYWLGQNLCVVSTPEMEALYVQATESQFLPVVRANAESMTLAGVKERAKERLKLDPLMSPQWLR